MHSLVALSRNRGIPNMNTVDVRQVAQTVVSEDLTFVLPSENNITILPHSILARSENIVTEGVQQERLRYMAVINDRQRDTNSIISSDGTNNISSEAIRESVPSGPMDGMGTVLQEAIFPVISDADRVGFITNTQEVKRDKGKERIKDSVDGLIERENDDTISTTIQNNSLELSNNLASDVEMHNLVEKLSLKSEEVEGVINAINVDLYDEDVKLLSISTGESSASAIEDNSDVGPIDVENDVLATNFIEWDTSLDLIRSSDPMFYSLLPQNIEVNSEVSDSLMSAAGSSSGSPFFGIGLGFIVFGATVFGVRYYIKKFK